MEKQERQGLSILNKKGELNHNSETQERQADKKRKIRLNFEATPQSIYLPKLSKKCMRLNFDERGANDDSVYAIDAITLDGYLTKKNLSKATITGAKQKLHTIVFKYHIYAPTEEGLDSLLDQLRTNGAPQTSQAGSYNNVFDVL